MGYISVLIALLISVFWFFRREEKIDMVGGLVVGNIFFALIPMGLTIFVGPIDSEGLPIPNFEEPSLDLGLFVLSFSLSLITVGTLSQKKTRFELKTNSSKFCSFPNSAEFQWIWLISVLALFVFFFNSGKMIGNHWADHGDSGFIGSLVGLLFISLRAYIYALAILVLPIHPVRTLTLLTMFTVLDVLLTGNRISVLYLTFSIIMSRSFRFYALALMGALTAPAAYFLAVFYPAFRGVVWSQFGGFSGFGNAFSYVWANGGNEALDVTKIFRIFEAYNVVIFQYIFEQFGNSHEFLDGETVIVKPLVFFVPRQIWPSKPESLNVQVGQGIFGVDGLSLNTLMLGEFYANFGWLAPFFLLLLIGIVALLIRKIPIFHDPRSQVAAFILAFSSWRHEFNYFVYGFCTLAVIIFLTGVVRRRAQRKNLLSIHAHGKG